MKEWNHTSLSPDILPHCLLFESIVIQFHFLYRQKINAKNGGTYEERSGRSTCITIYEDDSETLEDSSNKRQELWTEKLFIIGVGRNTISLSLEHSCRFSWEMHKMGLVWGLPWFYFHLFTICFLLSGSECLNSHLNYIDFFFMTFHWKVMCSVARAGCTIFSSTFTYFIMKTLIWKFSSYKMLTLFWTIPGSFS